MCRRGTSRGAVVRGEGDEAATGAKQPDRDRHVVRRDSDDHVGRWDLDEVAGAAGPQDSAQQSVDDRAGRRVLRAGHNAARDGHRVAPTYAGERGKHRGQLGGSGV